MQLKNIFLALFIIFSIQTFAQKPIELNGGKMLYDSIYSVTSKNIDELQKINQSGILLVRLDLSKDRISKIEFSSEFPAQLITLLKSVLQEAPIKLKPRSIKTIIIPIIYDYKTVTPATAADLLKMIPAIDVNKFPAPKSKDEYDQFLGITSKKDEISGIACVFLPWIRLSGKIQ